MGIDARRQEPSEPATDEVRFTGARHRARQQQSFETPTDKQTNKQIKTRNSAGMDELGNLSGGKNTALLVLTFLEADSANAEYRKEIVSLGQEIHLSWDISRNGLREDGDLETDGHLSSSVRGLGFGVEPVVELQQPDFAAVQRFAEELREIADQLEHNVVAQATHNLSRNILASPSEKWIDHLSCEVNRLLGQNVTFKDLAQEQVIVALTLTLVKGVCRQTPQLLRNLFNTALQYITHTGDM